MSAQPVQVLVLYSHALMGKGLEVMLSDEAGVVVDAVDATSAAAVEAALASHPRVIVVEEGSGIDAVDVARRSSCALVLDVDIMTTRAWTLRRESVSSHPDDFLATIRGAIADQADGDPEAAGNNVLAKPGSAACARL